MSQQNEQRISFVCTLCIAWLLAACSTPTTSFVTPLSPSVTPTIRPSGTPMEPMIGDIDTSQTGWRVPNTDAYDPGATYRLVPIEVDSLLSIFYGLSQLESEMEMGYVVYEEYNDEHQIRQALTHELAIFSDPEMTQALSLIEQMADEEQSGLSGEQDVERIFTAGFLVALNQESPDLSLPGSVSVFDYEAIPLDLDHDGIEEWLIDVTIPVLGNHRTLPIDQDEDGVFSLLPHDPLIPPWSRFIDADFYNYSKDVNGDGLPDLVLYEVNGLSKMRIYVWHSGSLQGLSFHPDFDWAQELTIDGYEEFTFEDLDGDGVTELRLGDWGGAATLNWDVCDYQVDLLEWRGIEVTSTRVEGMFPSQEPECLITGVLFQEPQPIPDQQLLERIVTGLEAEDWEKNPAWYALAHIKLSAIQWISGNEHRAYWTMAPIWQYRGENASVMYWRELWEASEDDFLQFCRSLYRNYSERGDLSGGYSERLYQLGGRFNENLAAIPMGEYFCPSTTLSQKLLSETVFPLSLAPEAGLAQVGVPILFAETVDLDDDPDLEWTGVVDGGGLIWASWDATEMGWQNVVSEVLSHEGFITPTLDEFEFCLLDVSGDGNDDLISLRQLSGERYGSQKDTEMFLAVYDLEADELLLDVSVDIDDLSEVDQDLVDMLVDRVHMEQLIPPMGMMPFYIQVNGEDKVLRSFLHESLDGLLMGGDPAMIRAGLEQALAQIPESGINADLAIRQIQYLIGYSYELEGDAAGAISAYRHLIEAAPESYWSWLAWARMAE